MTNKKGANEKGPRGAVLLVILGLLLFYRVREIEGHFEKKCFAREMWELRESFEGGA
jgi:hypothetical protein